MAEEIVPQTPPVEEPTAPPVKDPVTAPLEPPVEAVLPVESVPPVEEPTGEPGGSDGASVYQRKLFRENKQLKDKIQLQEVEKARVDERLKVTEEHKTETKKTERIFTISEIETAVSDDKISRADAERYKSEIIYPRWFDDRLDKRDKEREEKDKRERPVNRAKTEISEYIQLIPSLTIDGDPGANQVFQRRNHLISELGYVDNEITTLAAIEHIKGPLDKLRTQSEVRNLTRNGTGTHAETGAGGNDNRVSPDVLKKVPKEMIAHWEKQGASPEEIKKYAARHVEKINSRRTRFAT